MRGRVFRRCPAGSTCGPRCGHSWAVAYDVPPGPGGRRRQQTRSGFRTRDDAEAALTTALAAVRNGVDSGNGRGTTGDYLTTWLAGKRALRPTTAECYRSHLELYLIPHLGHVRLSELRAAHLDSMYAAMTARTERPLSPATVRRVHSTLHNALASAVKRRLLAFNPADQVELPSAPRTPVVVWTPAHVARWLEHTATDRLAALWRVTVLVGLRRGELVGLRWADVDLSAGHLRVAQSVTAAGRSLHVGEPKTKSGVRTVPLDAATVAALRSHRKAQAAERLAWAGAGVETGFVFTREDGAMLHPEHLSRRFRVLARHAGLPPIRLHDGRHTSASLALAAGVAMKTVSDRLGHSTTWVTADTYSHVTPAVAQDAADRIAALVARSS